MDLLCNKLKMATIIQDEHITLFLIILEQHVTYQNLCFHGQGVQICTSVNYIIK